MQRLLLIGLNHTTAPLEVRERLAFAPKRIGDAALALRDSLGAEAVVLSTCNRVEIYLSTPDVIARAPVVDFLARFHKIPTDAFESHLYEVRGRGVIEHVFAVASSLDSMVLGETQILGQVRDAYETARATGATGATLNPLFQRAVAVGKDVLAKSGLADGRVSIASVAADYARHIFESFDDKTVLCLGTGKMSRLVLQRFASMRLGQLLVCSRDIDRAGAIAGEFGGQGVAFADIDRHLVASDIVICSTGAPHPVITRSRFEKLRRARRHRPIFFIDIAVPRDVEAGVGEIDDVYLYNLDDLQEVVKLTMAERGTQVQAATLTVNEEVERFLIWQRQREIGPMIDALYKRSGTIAKTEVQRTLARLPLDDVGKAELEQLAHRIVQKMLHDPITTLRSSHTAHEGAAAGYAHAIEKLFKLDKELPEPPKDVDVT